MFQSVSGRASLTRIRCEAFYTSKDIHLFIKLLSSSKEYGPQMVDCRGSDLDHSLGKDITLAQSLCCHR